MKNYDLLTRNESFIKVSQQLKSLGIKNHQFMLEIYDTDLIGIDPYNKDLSEEMQKKIKKECEINPWYYLREMACINVYGNRIMLRLNRGTAAQIYCILNGIDSYLVIPRQTGKTQAMIMLYAWLIFISQYKNLTSYMVSNSHNSSCERVDYMRKHICTLPRYIFNTDLVTIKRKFIASKSSDSIVNSYTTLEYTRSIQEYVFPLIQGYPYFDDVEFTKNSADFLLEYERAKNLVHRFHSFGCGISSTPGRLSDDICMKVCNKIIYKSIWWDDGYYDNIQEFKTLLSLCRGDMISIAYIEFSYKQLGLSDDWARKMYELINNEDAFRREILLQREIPKQTFEEMIAIITDDLPEDLKS